MKRKKAIRVIAVLLIMATVISVLAIAAIAAVSSSVVSGELKLYISSISTSGGTTRLSADNLRGNLNRKSSSAPDYWLYANFTTNADEAITGIWIKNSDNVTSIDGFAVTKASVNVNSASKTACYIYYTKDKNAGDPIASVGVWQSEDKYFEYATNLGSELQEYYDTGFNDNYAKYGYTRVGGDSSDLNTGAGSKTAYVYIYYKRAPHVKTQAVEYCYDGQPHNGIVTASDGATVTFEKSYTEIGSYNQVYKVTKDGMITISGDTPVKISKHDYSISLNNAVATSCKAAGHETDMKCSKCGAVKAGAVIPKLDHTYKNVICTVCGALEDGYTKIKTSTTYYKIDGDTIYIGGKGEIPFAAFRQNVTDSIKLGSTVKKLVILDGVTSIANSVFNNCPYLTSVTIPNSVTNIGLSSFFSCKGLTSVTIPNSVTNIGEDAFNHCSGLTSITIPGSVKSIGKNAFANCTSLQSVVLQSGITSLSESMFENCTSMTSVTIPDSLKTIGIYAFFGCQSLTSITIPNSVTSLASNAFSGCTKLSQATLPCRLNYSFYSITRVTKVHIGDVVTDASKVATCTENGLTEGTHCSVCNAALTAQKVIPANGHTWKDANCTTPKTCTVCSATEGGIPGHTWGNWNVWQEPSCAETGVRGRICERCHAEETEEIPTTDDHYWGNWNEMRPASCAESGVLIRYCDRCKTSETQETPKTNDHIWSDWFEQQPATCTAPGTRYRICYCCYQNEQEPLGALGHDWKDGVCTVCGEADPDVPQYMLGDIDNDGKLTVKDLNIMKRILLGIEEMTPAADMDGNGKITTSDISTLKSIILG